MRGNLLDEGEPRPVSPRSLGPSIVGFGVVVERHGVTAPPLHQIVGFLLQNEVYKKKVELFNDAL